MEKAVLSQAPPVDMHTKVATIIIPPAKVIHFTFVDIFFIFV
jgi:hypothetical protein